MAKKKNIKKFLNLNEIENKVEKLARIDKKNAQLSVVLPVVKELEDLEIPKNTPLFFLRDVIKNNRDLNSLCADRVNALKKNVVPAKFSENIYMNKENYFTFSSTEETNFKKYEKNPKPQEVKPLKKITIDNIKNMNEEELSNYYNSLEKGAEAFKNHGFIRKILKKEGKIPFAIKDLYWKKGELCTNSSKMLQCFQAPDTATLIKKLEEKGYYVSMITNNDEFACGAFGNKSGIKDVYSPIFVDGEPLAAGGSSSGCAAAVAAGIVPFAIGSETGGSMRLPGHFTGTVGFKPSVRTISRYGMMELNGEIDMPGIIANNVEDVKTVYDIIKGLDSNDPTVVMPKLPKEKKVLGYFGEEVYKEIGIEDTINKIKEIYKDQYIFKKISIKNLDYAIIAYYILTMTNLASVNNRYNSLLYGDGSKVKDFYKESRSELFGPEIRRRISGGCYLSRLDRESGIKKARQLLYILNEQMKEIFSECHLIIGPVGPVAPTYEQSFKSSVRDEYLCDKFLCFVNLLGLCGISLPLTTHKKRPCGVQIIGAYGADEHLLNFSNNLFQAWKHN